MIGDAIAAFIGNRIDSSDGEGGTLGAIAGVAAWKVAKHVIPAALVLGAIAYGVHRFARADAAA